MDVVQVILRQEPMAKYTTEGMLDPGVRDGAVPNELGNHPIVVASALVPV